MGVVYMIHDAGRGLYRVGRTKALRSRVLTHYKERVGDLRLVWYIVTNGADLLESHCHRLWREQRVRGEWFDLTPEQVAHFRSVRLVNYSNGDELTERQRRVNLRGGSGARPKYLIECGKVIRPIQA